MDLRRNRFLNFFLNTKKKPNLHIIMGFFFFVFSSCTTRSINLRPDLPPQQRNAEVARLLSSSLASVKVLEEDIPRLIDALSDELPQIRQFAIRILGLYPRADIYQAISSKLTDEDASVRKEALQALLRAPIEYKEILYSTIDEENLSATYRDPLVGRLSQFGAAGEQLLIQLLSHPDLSIARVAARNLKRLYPDYPNPKLTQLLAERSTKAQLAASAWLASYNESSAVREQLILTTNQSAAVSRRASLLFQNAESWVIPIIEKMLSSQELSEPKIRKILIQKLLENKSPSGQRYLAEFFSYVKNEAEQNLCVDYIMDFNKVGFQQIQKALASQNQETQKVALQIAEKFQDKATIIASIPLINSANPDIKRLARTYIEKATDAMAEDLAGYLDTQRNNGVDRALFYILFNAGVPQLLWYPYKKDVDPLRLNYMFKNVSQTQFFAYLKKNRNLIYTLELRLIYQLFKKGVTYKQNSLSFQKESPLVEKSLKIVEIALQQENPNSADLSGSLKLQMLEWYSLLRKSTPEEKAAFQSYRNESIEFYQDYLAIFPSYRNIATTILVANGINMDTIRGMSTYSPRA